MQIERSVDGDDGNDDTSDDGNDVTSNDIDSSLAMAGQLGLHPCSQEDRCDNLLATLLTSCLTPSINQLICICTYIYVYTYIHVHVYISCVSYII